MLKIVGYLLKSKVWFLWQVISGVGIYFVGLAFTLAALLGIFEGQFTRLNINYELAYDLLVLVFVAKKLITDTMPEVLFSSPSMHFLVHSPIDTHLLVGAKLTPTMVGAIATAGALEVLAAHLGGWEISYLRAVSLMMLLTSVVLVKWLLYNARQTVCFGARIGLALAFWLAHHCIPYSALLLAPMVVVLTVISARDVMYVNWPKLAADSRFVYLTPRLFLAGDLAGMQQLLQERQPRQARIELLSKWYFPNWKAIIATHSMLLVGTPWQAVLAYLVLALGVDWFAPNAQPLGLVLLLLATINTLAPSCSCVLDKRLQGFSIPLSPPQSVGALVVVPFLLFATLVLTYLVLSPLNVPAAHVLMILSVVTPTATILTIARACFLPPWGLFFGLAPLAVGVYGLLNSFLLLFYASAILLGITNYLSYQISIKHIGGI